MMNLTHVQGNYPQADNLYRQAFTIGEAAPDLDRLDFAALLEKLADLAMKQVNKWAIVAISLQP